MLMLILATIVVVILFYYVIVKQYDYWKERGVKQGPSVWIAGDNWKMIFRKENFVDMTQRVYKQFPGVRYSGMYQFLTPVLVLKDPDLIKQITVKDFDHFVDHRSFLPVNGDTIWNRNLIALKGQNWRDMRSILSPSFTSSKMKSMFVLISECAENFVQHFLKKNEDVVTIEFKETFRRFTNDVIATTAFGIQVDSLDEPENRFYKMGQLAMDFSGLWRSLKFLGFFLFPKIYSYFNIDLFPKEVTTFFLEVVADTIRIREEKNIVRPDVINLLLEARKGIDKQEEDGVIDTGFSTAQESNMVKSAKLPKKITDIDITAQAMAFFLGGFDTVSGHMCFLAYELAANPDIQDRLREEVRFTLEECGGKLTYDALFKMKYMDMVISEALRKWPIAPATDRVCTKPYTIEPTAPDEKPLHIEKDDLLWFPIYGIHHDPEYFPNPERFDPERFNDENKRNINPYTYFPFGLGPRNCIGSRFALLETKVMIFHILKSFELVPVEKSIIPLQLSKKQMNLTAEGGFWFGLKRISA